jgi:hypothetical protein
VLIRNRVKNHSISKIIAHRKLDSKSENGTCILTKDRFEGKTYIGRSILESEGKTHVNHKGSNLRAKHVGD